MEFFYPMYGCGRNFKLCHTSTHHGILRFQKIKFSKTLASIGARQIAAQTFSYHKFQAQSLSLDQDNSTQNSGEFVLEN
jgi:hypothetical protein